MPLILQSEKKILEERIFLLWEMILVILLSLCRRRENELYGLGTKTYTTKKSRLRKVEGIVQKYLATSPNPRNQDMEETELFNYVDKLREEKKMLETLIQTYETESGTRRNSTQQEEPETFRGESGDITYIDWSSDSPLPIIHDSSDFFQGLEERDDDDDDEQLNSTKVGANIGFFVIIKSEERDSVAKIIEEKIVGGMVIFTVELYKPVSHHSYTFVQSEVTLYNLTENDLTLWLGDPTEIRSGLKFPNNLKNFRIHMDK